MKLSIVVLTPGPGEGRVIPINGKQFLIGRDPGCHLRPASNHISKRHCAILWREDKIFLRDFGSTNGTFVNDRQIRAGEIELLDGDRLRVGPLEFALHFESAPVTPSQPPPSEATHESEPSPAAISPAEEPTQSADNDEDAAAILLTMQGSGPSEAGPRPDATDVATVMDATADTLTDKEKEKPKEASGDTSTAAESIFGKYLKRPRPS